MEERGTGLGFLHEKIKPNIVTVSADKLFNWSRLSSLWMLFFGIACCGIEGMAAGAPRLDFDRYGIIPRATPRQADFIVVAGPVVKKMVPVLKVLWAQMPEPKYAISMGSCAITGGWSRDSYNVVRGAHKVIPIDVHVPGCHPRPEGLLYGILLLQEKIRQESYTKYNPKLALNGNGNSPGKSPIIVPEDVTIDQIVDKAESME